MSELLGALTVGAIGAVLALDRTAFLQTMASRPLVASALVGAVLGNMDLGLRCGLMLELFWLMELPVGASVPPDDTVASILATAFAIAAPAAWSPQARAALGVLGALPFGVVGRYVDMAVRRQNGKLVARARVGGKGAKLARLHLRGALHFALASGLLVAGGALLGGTGIRWAAPRFPVVGEAALELSAALLPLVGTAAVLAALRNRRFAALAGIGLFGGLLGGELAHVAGEGAGPWPR